MLANAGGGPSVLVSSRQVLNATPQSMHMVNGYDSNLMANSVKQVHSLDLINGVDSAVGGGPNSGPVSYNSRPMRLRMYNTKNGMVRHETKL